MRFTAGFGPKKRPIIILVVIFLAFLVGYWWRGTGQESAMVPAYPVAHSEHGEKEKDMLYVCPMMCVPPMKTPGKCPVCGMDLVPLEAWTMGDQEGPPRLKLSKRAVKIADIQTARVERKFVFAETRLFGQIDYDPAHITYITAFMPGVIDRVYVKRAGQFVRWGDPLFDIYSSDLLDTQRQLIDAMKYVPSFLAYQKGSVHAARDMPVQERKGGEDPTRRSPEVEAAHKTIEGIRHKLQILGLPKRDIDQMMKKGEATGIATVYASMYGQVIAQNAYEGTYVNKGAPIFTLGDPRYVWVKLDAYEMDYPWLRKGQEVSFQTDAYPGEAFKGKVVYIDPVFNTSTRTFSVGAVSPDPGGRLKAGMLVRAVILARLTAEGKVVNDTSKKEQAPLVIPASAPLITGRRAVVYVALDGQEGVFEGREVTLGPRAKDYYVVLGGLREGESVVMNGNFKIDSAVQILAKSSMMDMEGAYPATAYHHPGGSDAMSEAYQQERMKSRMGNETNSDESVYEDRSSIQPQESARPYGRTREWSTIRRRKPGSYGDTTRPKPLPQQR